MSFPIPLRSKMPKQWSGNGRSTTLLLTGRLTCKRSLYLNLKFILMKHFDQTQFYQLLEPFLTPVLSRLYFLDDRYIGCFTQILLSGLLYLTAGAIQKLALQLIQRVDLPTVASDILSSFTHLGSLLAIFWSIWYILTIIFRVANLMRFGFHWLTPRVLSCVITGGMPLSIALKECEAVGYVSSWFYGLLILTWAFSCLRPTLFAADKG